MKSNFFQGASVVRIGLDGVGDMKDAEVILVYRPFLTYLTLAICPTLSEYPIYFYI